jgi:acyl-CoA thioesterase-1
MRLSWAVWLVACSVLSNGCAAPQPVTGPPPQPSVAAPPGRTIVAFGDSLTAGYGLDPDQAYPAQLERKLRADGHPWKVINAGSSGETSSGALQRVTWVLRMHPDLVVLETGANDGLRGIAPRVTQANLVSLVRSFKQHHVAVVLCGMQITSNMGASYTQAFAAVYPAVAHATGVALVPFFLQGVGGNPSLNLEDGLHPTAEGYALVVHNVYPLVVDGLK